MKELKAIFANTNEDYIKIKQSAESKVIDWFWSKGSVVDLEPYHSERFKLPKSKKLVSEPKEKENHTKNGVDNLGQIVIEIEYDNIAQYETYYERKNNIVISYRFHVYKEPNIQNCNYYIFENNKLLNLNNISNYAITETTYHYDNDTLVSQNDERLNLNTKEKRNRIYNYEYDEMKILKGIREGTFYWYSRKKDLSFNDLLLETKCRLLHLLQKHIKNNAPKEQIFTIFMGYHLDNYFPFSIAYGLESERKKFIKERDFESIWEYQQYELFYEHIGENEEDTNLFEELNQQIAMKEKQKIAEKTVLNIVHELKNYLKEFKLNTTDDFVFAVSDYEMKNFKKHLKKINPKEYKKIK